MNWLEAINSFMHNDRNTDYGQNAMSRQGYSVPEQYTNNSQIPQLDLISSPQGNNETLFGLGKGGEGNNNSNGILGSNGLNLGLQGLQTIAGLWNANKMYKMANKQFNMQKEFANANLNNTIQSYNTRLSDRARSRGFVEGQSQQQIDDYVNKNRMSR